ncbi:MAG: PqqD family protein [Anaerolineae bacterium]|nr:PqqD family protein [Anaerolineae bacterium]
MLSLDSTIMISPDAVYSDIEDEVVILNPTNGEYYGLNPVGALVWKLAQSPVKVSAVRDAILDSFEVSPEECERDLLELLEDMAGQGLIEVTP